MRGQGVEPPPPIAPPQAAPAGPTAKKVPKKKKKKGGSATPLVDMSEAEGSEAGGYDTGCEDAWVEYEDPEWALENEDPEWYEDYEQGLAEGTC